MLDGQFNPFERDSQNSSSCTNFTFVAKALRRAKSAFPPASMLGCESMCFEETDTVAAFVKGKVTRSLCTLVRSGERRITYRHLLRFVTHAIGPSSIMTPAKPEESQQSQSSFMCACSLYGCRPQQRTPIKEINFGNAFWSHFLPNS